MNLTNSNPRFSVYVHRSPSGKIYVGITSQSLEQRWGHQGSGYRDNKHFWAAICKYGWDNFQHEVVATDLGLVEASAMESQLIAEYNAMNPEHGYNHTTGGNWSTPSDEVREVLRTSAKLRWRNPTWRTKVISSLQGHPMSENTKQKISETKKGRPLGHPSPLRGRTLSEAHKVKLRGRVAWNAGLTKATHPGIAAGAAKLQGRKRTPEQLENIRNAKRQLYDRGYSPMWVTDGKVESLIDASIDPIPPGFVAGRLARPDRFMYKDDICRRVPVDQIESYLANGWQFGRGPAIQQALRASQQQYIWYLDDKTFSTSVELAEYLREHGFPKIVGSTITSLYLKGFKKSKIYYSLEGRVRREPVTDENQVNRNRSS